MTKMISMKTLQIKKLHWYHVTNYKGVSHKHIHYLVSEEKSNDSLSSLIFCKSYMWSDEEKFQTQYNRTLCTNLWVANTTFTLPDTRSDHRAIYTKTWQEIKEYKTKM